MRFTVLIGLLLAACSGAKEEAFACPGATVPASWTEWKLPLDRGKVCTASDREIQVLFAAGDQETLYNRFAGAAEARGFIPDDEAAGRPPCKDNVCGQLFTQGDTHASVSAVAMTAFKGKPILVSVSK
jgi:hypothetical protein